MIKKPGTAEWELERIGAPERTPQPERNPSFVPAAVAMQQVPLGLRRRPRIGDLRAIVIDDCPPDFFEHNIFTVLDAMKHPAGTRP